MKIPRSYIEAYSNRLNWLSGRARSELESALARIDYSAPTADVRDAVIAVMQQMCGASSTVAARLAADFYDGLRTRFGIDDGFTAEVADTFDPGGVDGAVRALVDVLDEGGPVERFVRGCSDRIDYEVRKSANECIAHNAKRDPKRPRWARVPVGACTCDWCIMLASRGFDYHTEDTASHAHPNCDCRCLPSWDSKGAAVEGYDVAYYEDCYEHPEKHPEIREAQNARRRELYAERKYRRRIDEAEVIHERFYDLGVEDVIRERELYDKELHRKWGEYKKRGGDADAYMATIGEYVQGLSITGKLHVEPFVDLKDEKGKEVQLAKWFADAGHEVWLRLPSSTGETNDATIDGSTWEFKRVTSKNPRKITARVMEKVPRQGPRFVVDLSENRMTSEESERKVAQLLDKKGVSEVMLVQNGQVKLFRK